MLETYRRRMTRLQEVLSGRRTIRRVKVKAHKVRAYEVAAHWRLVSRRGAVSREPKKTYTLGNVVHCPECNYWYDGRSPHTCAPACASCGRQHPTPECPDGPPMTVEEVEARRAGAVFSSSVDPALFAQLEQSLAERLTSIGGIAITKCLECGRSNGTHRSGCRRRKKEYRHRLVRIRKLASGDWALTIHWKVGQWPVQEQGWSGPNLRELRRLARAWGGVPRRGRGIAVGRRGEIIGTVENVTVDGVVVTVKL